MIRYSSTFPRAAGSELIARFAGTLCAATPSFRIAALSYKSVNLRRGRVAEEHLTLSSHELHDDVPQTFLIVTVEALGRVGREHAT